MHGSSRQTPGTIPVLSATMQSASPGSPSGCWVGSIAQGAENVNGWPSLHTQVPSEAASVPPSQKLLCPPLTWDASVESCPHAGPVDADASS